MAATREEKVQITLEASTNKYKDELDNLTRKQSVLTGQLKEMQKGTKEYADTSKELRKVTERMAEIQKETGVTGLSMKQLQNLSKQLNAQFANATPGTAEWESLRDRLQEVNGRMKDLKGAANGDVIAKQLGPIKKESDLAGLSIAHLEKLLSEMKEELRGIDPGSEKFQSLGKEAQIVEGRLNGLKASTGAFSNELAQLIPGFSNFQRGGQAIGAMRGGVTALTGSFGLLGGAIAATGIGLLVVAMGALYVWFTKTDTGAKIMEGTMNAISNVIGVLGTRVQALIEGRFGDAFSGLGSDIVKATKAGYEFAEATDTLDESQRAAALSIAKLETEIEKLLIQSKNRTLSEKDRIALLNKAGELEREVYKRKVALLNEEIETERVRLVDKISAANKELNLTAKTKEQQLQILSDYIQNRRKLNQGDVSDDELNKLKDLLVKGEDLKKESNAVTEKIDNRRDQLDQQAEEKRQKRAEERRKAEEKAAKKREQFIQDQQKAAELQDQFEVERMDDSLEKSIRILDKELAARKVQIAGLKITEAAKTALFEEAEKSRDAKAIAAWDKNAEDIKKRDEELAKQQLDAANKLAKDKLEIELNAANSSGRHQDIMNARVSQLELERSIELQNTELTEEQRLLIIQKYQDLINGVRKKGREDEEGELKEAMVKLKDASIALFNDLGQLSQANAQRTLNEKEKEKQAKLKKLEEEFKAGKISTEKYEKDKAKIDADYAAQEEQIKKEQAARNKRFALLEIANKLAMEIAGYMASYPSTSSLGVVGGILSGIAIARAAAQAATVQAQQYATGGTIDPKRGGMVNGSSHAQGGVLLYDRAQNRILGEIEGGEEIRIYRKDLSNAARYHLDMASITQGSPNKFATGGTVGGEGPSMPSDTGAVVSAIDRLREDISTWQSEFQVVNVLTETETGLKRIQKVRNEAAI